MNDREILEAALDRGRLGQLQLIKECGGFLSTAEAAKLLGVTPEALLSGKSLTLLAVPVSDNDVGWPMFQFESLVMIEAVGRTLSRLDISSLWMQVNFFFMKFPELGDRRPIDLIREGEIGSVEIAASHCGTHGAA